MMIFADAEAGYEESLFVIFGVPFEDKEMSFRSGTAEAPDFIRYAGWNYESYDMETDIDLQNIAIHDAGNVTLEKAPELIRKIRNDGKTPIGMGGAHSITPPLVASLDEEFGVMVLDAHMDFRDEYLGDAESHACTSRRIFDRVGKERIVSVGVRSASRNEVKDAGELGFTYYHGNRLAEPLEIPFENIYLSVDMDVFDPSLAPGVSNPEPNGAGYEILELIGSMAKRIIAMDVVEVCPSYDDGRTALLAAKLIRDFICRKVA